MHEITPDMCIVYKIYSHMHHVYKHTTDIVRTCRTYILRERIMHITQLLYEYPMYTICKTTRVSYKIERTLYEHSMYSI